VWRWGYADAGGDADSITDTGTADGDTGSCDTKAGAKPDYGTLSDP
jgi:hypothetical protein